MNLLPLAIQVLHSPRLLWGLEVAWLVGAAAWLLLERRPPAATMAWFMGLAFLPVLGIPVYLYLGPRRLRRKREGRRRAKHASARLRVVRGEAGGRVPPGSEPFAHFASRLDVPPPLSATAVTLFSEGDAAWEALLAAFAAARDHIHLEYYIFASDRTGARVRDALVERARAGVRVRLLVDAAGSARLSGRFLAPLVEAGGRVARFNPAFRGRSSRLFNFRTHRKIVVCDGRVGFTGGINVIDNQSGAVRGEAAWRDTHLRLEGTAVAGLQAAFLDDWAYADPWRLPQVSEALHRCFFPECAPGPHVVHVVPGGPDQDLNAVAALYFAAITGARRRLWITTPYFVPDDAFAAALAGAALRGVDVQLLLPARSDNPLADAAGRTFHRDLLRAGAHIHLYQPRMIHAKAWVVDDQLALVGSANLDQRSLRLNFEVVAAVHGAATAAELAALFERDRALSVERLWRDEREDREPLSSRLVGSAARLLSPLL